MSSVIKGLLFTLPVLGIGAVIGAGEEISNALDRGFGRQKDKVERMRNTVKDETERVRARKAEWYVLSVPPELSRPPGEQKYRSMDSVEVMDFMMEHRDIDPYESALRDYEDALTNPLLPKMRGVKISNAYRERKERQAKEFNERYHKERNDLYNKLLQEGKVQAPSWD